MRREMYVLALAEVLPGNTLSLVAYRRLCIACRISLLNSPRYIVYTCIYICIYIYIWLRSDMRLAISLRLRNISLGPSSKIFCFPAEQQRLSGLRVSAVRESVGKYRYINI